MLTALGQVASGTSVTRVETNNSDSGRKEVIAGSMADQSDQQTPPKLSATEPKTTELPAQLTQ